MATVAVKATSYCLNHTPELGLSYGTTPYQERHANPESPFLADLVEAGGLVPYVRRRLTEKEVRP